MARTTNPTICCTQLDCVDLSLPLAHCAMNSTVVVATIIERYTYELNGARCFFTCKLHSSIVRCFVIAVMCAFVPHSIACTNILMCPLYVFYQQGYSILFWCIFSLSSFIFIHLVSFASIHIIATNEFNRKLWYRFEPNNMTHIVYVVYSKKYI